ncbi:TetR-like C-terminal domain-containing protein [Micromonospora sp. DT81.3]|uniref:TetR-like C-terminal domain-containing protein n=1 Tax=Micromonospora sp. DT81.3 TaxID=3416523 RepID=UPI003CEB1C5B
MLQDEEPAIGPLISLGSLSVTGDCPPADEAIRHEVFAPRLAVLETVFAEAQQRGEVPTDGNIALLARTGAAVLFQQILLTGEQPTAHDVAAVISQILLPASAKPNPEYPN